MRNILLISFCLIIVNVLFAQTLRFEHPTDPTKFLRGTILDLVQDQQGFIWIATSDGLGKYDGKSVVEYRNIRGDSTSISNNYISDLWLDAQGQLWIGTKSGLNCYHPEKDNFTRYFNYDVESFESGNYILYVIQDSKGYIWYSTYEGVIRFHPETGDYIQFDESPENTSNFTSALTYGIFEDSKDRLWFATYDGITLYENDGSLQFKNFDAQSDNPNGLTHGSVFNFTEQADGTIWGSSHYGIYKVIEENNNFRFKRYYHQEDNENSLSYDFIENIRAEGNDRLWVCTWAGGLDEVILPKEEKEDLQFIHHQHSSSNSNSVSINQVKVSLRDHSGVLWVGTSNGLDKVVATNWKFSGITPIKNDAESLSHRIIKSVVKDSQGNLWIGTYNGLNFLSRENWEKKNFQFQKFKHDKNDPTSISHNNIFGMQEDSLGFLWFGTYRGLNYVDINSLSEKPIFKTIDFPDKKPHTWVYNISEISKGKYWILTYGKMARMTFNPLEDKEPVLEIFDMDDEREDALVNATTYQASKDRFGNYWIATFLGVSRHYQRNGLDYFDNYKLDVRDSTSISDNSIVCMHLDKKGRFWIGTRNGLNVVVQDKPTERAKFKSFGSANGFPNDVIQSLEEDEDGKFWIGTNKGLVHFDPDAALKNRPCVIRIYNQDDGVLGQGLVFRASTSANDGTMFFGTANGLNYFHPSQLPENQNVANIVFTELKVANQKVKPSIENKSILKKSISLTDSLILKHNQNDIELQFAALEFANPTKNQYQYKLENYNEDWIFNKNNNTATYTNLPSGEFILKVKASNNEGIWNETPKKLFIKVLPPWWRTWWAYLFYVLSFFGLIYSWVRWRVQQRIYKIQQQAKIQAARYEEREDLRKKNAADFHDELGHRLTKVSLFLELAEREAKGNSTLKNFLNKIKTNTTGLSEGIRDLIWSLDPKKDTLYQTVVRLQEFGDRLFEFSDIKFKTEGIDEALEKIELEPEARKHVLMIFKEAMNNSLKYSKAEKAMLQTKSENGHVAIIFKDDGLGFDEYKIKNGYGLKNMQERANKIGGKLEIKSEKESGTTISLILISVNYAVGNF